MNKNQETPTDKIPRIMHRKVETFKNTEFGPISTGHTMETTSCENCFKLQQELDAARELFTQAHALLKQRDEQIKELEGKLNGK